MVELVHWLEELDSDHVRMEERVVDLVWKIRRGAVTKDELKQRDVDSLFDVFEDFVAEHLTEEEQTN